MHTWGVRGRGQWARRVAGHCEGMGGVEMSGVCLSLASVRSWQVQICHTEEKIQILAASNESRIERTMNPVQGARKNPASNHTFGVATGAGAFRVGGGGNTLPSQPHRGTGRRKPADLGSRWPLQTGAPSTIVTPPSYFWLRKKTHNLVI